MRVRTPVTAARADAAPTPAAARAAGARARLRRIRSPRQRRRAPCARRGPLAADFDAEQFVRHARTNFVNLQAAHDRKDLAAIRDFLTPELTARSRADIRASGDARREDRRRDARMREVLDVATENGLYVVSVRFSGLIREGAGRRAAAVQRDLASREAGERPLGLARLRHTAGLTGVDRLVRERTLTLEKPGLTARVFLCSKPLAVPPINRLLRANAGRSSGCGRTPARRRCSRCPPFELALTVLERRARAAAPRRGCRTSTIVTTPGVLLRLAARDETRVERGAGGGRRRVRRRDRLRAAQSRAGTTRRT